jgi:alpha-galactosidase
MARLARSSLPLDLMSYTPADGMPSIFLLHESKRQSILTVFNWTENQSDHKLDLSSDLRLPVQDHNQISDVFDSKQVSTNRDSVDVSLPPHSVAVLKIIDTSISPAAPTIQINVPDSARAGDMVKLSAQPDPAGVPALRYQWDFGDGTTSSDQNAEHSYTHAGDFTIRLHVNGLDGVPLEESAHVRVSGNINTRFAPKDKRRFSER